MNLKYRDIGSKSVNRYTDRETVSRIATFGKCQPYSRSPAPVGVELLDSSIEA